MFPWQHYTALLRKILNFGGFGRRTAHPLPLGFNVSSNTSFRGQLKLFFPLGLEVMTVQHTVLHCLRTDNFICSSQTGIKTPKTLPNELVETGVIFRLKSNCTCSVVFMSSTPTPPLQKAQGNTSSIKISSK